VFLDRGGTIAEEAGHLNHLDRFRMFPFVPEAIRRLNEAGVPVVAGHTDMELAFKGGARAVMGRTGYGLGELAWRAQEWQRQPDCVAEDLQTAGDWILRENR
jgi:hypothetical protein